MSTTTTTTTTTTTCRTVPECIPSVVWAEVMLQMVDVSDLMFAPDWLLDALPPGATFVAKRVLSAYERAWLAKRDIPVTLFAQRHTVNTLAEARTVSLDTHWIGCINKKYPLQVWTLNGLVHRENDLPAAENQIGDLVWFCYGQVHRDFDLPAIGFAKGGREWWQHGQLHREGDRPAVEASTGSRAWYIRGKRHRDGGLPARDHVDGIREWYVRGKLHRDNDLPAVELGNGHCSWFWHGKRHREGDQPAYVDPVTGVNAWWIMGVMYTASTKTAPEHG